MNYSTAVFLINDDVRAVAISYEPAKYGDDTPDVTIFKTFDKDLKKGDYVVVPTKSRHKMTVCRVEEVDVDINFDSDDEVDWIVGKVDRANFEEIEAQEQIAIDAVKSAERRRKKDELREALFKDHAESLKELEIANSAKALPANTENDQTN